MGNCLVRSVLARGDKVIATARSLHTIEDFPKSGNIRLMQLDVTDGFEKMKEKVAEAVQQFGRIDVVVNNAGIAVRSLLEEGGSQQCREQFETNVFGVLDVTSAVLPYMRERRSGTVVLLGSRSSWKADIPSSGFYSASKAAVRVLGETLSVELKEFNIRVLLVEPGAFRTKNIFSRPFYEGNKIADYDALREHAEGLYTKADGHQPGDPVKAMDVVVDVVQGQGRARGKRWPTILPLGMEAEQAIRNKSEVMQEMLDDWKDIIRDTRLDES